MVSEDPLKVPISFIGERITPEKYALLYNRLDFIEKRVAVQLQIRNLRQRQVQSIDLPKALAEAVNRGIINNFNEEYAEASSKYQISAVALRSTRKFTK